MRPYHHSLPPADGIGARLLDLGGLLLRLALLIVAVLLVGLLLLSLGVRDPLLRNLEPLLALLQARAVPVALERSAPVEAPAAGAAARAPAAVAPFCAPGQTPAYQFGFAALHARLGDLMGEPLECEHVSTADGDTLQRTTRGLAYYRKATNTPAFTDGWRHWALTDAGLLAWEGEEVDPPARARRLGP